MANGFGNFRTGASDGTQPVPARIPGAVNGGKQDIFIEKFDLSKANVQKVAGNRNLAAKIPLGHRPLSIKVRSSVSLTTSQLQFGDGITADKFGTAAAYGTTAGATVEYLKVVELGEPLAAETSIWMTITTADLPSSGIIVVMIETAPRA